MQRLRLLFIYTFPARHPLVVLAYMTDHPSPGKTWLLGESAAVHGEMHCEREVQTQGGPTGDARDAHAHCETRPRHHYR